MGALRTALETIRTYLGQLTGRDRLLIGALVAVAALTLLLVANMSSRTTMVELLPGMGPEANGQARTGLTEAGIEFEARNGAVFVRPEQRAMALATLGQAGKLPADAETLYSNLLKNQNWMASNQQNALLANAALCEFLGQVIGNFKGVERASVIIDAPEAVGLGTAVRRPTASVGVLMKQGRGLDKEMVDAVAALVAGARAGLDITSVKVIDLRNNRQFTARGPEDYAAGDYLELVTKVESRIQEKVRSMVAYDPLAIVAVSAQVDNTKVRRDTEKFLPTTKGGGSQQIIISEKTDTKQDVSAQNSGPGTAPGLSSNVSADISREGTGSGNTSNSSTEVSDRDFKVAIGSTRETVTDPRGMPTRINVMISLSREYLAHLAKMQKPAAAAGAVGGAAGGGAGGAAADAEPTQAEIEAVFAKEKTRLESEITPLIRGAAAETVASSDPRVVVSMIPVPQGLALVGGVGAQAGLLAVGGAAGTGGGGGGMMSQLLSGGVIRTAAMGLLAVVALGMMMLLVRKSSRPQKLPTAEEIVGLPPVMDMKQDVVGEADESQAAMVGIELGDNELKVKKMVEQVEEMIQKNPQDAAGMLKRWLTTGNE
ncbi:MAG: hypothetical protein MUE97_03025 [Phycisphaerales bacterium]|nr:hypothetical protein [Phycisphaerales bacterium]